MKKTIIIAALLAAGFSTAASADPVRIRIGWAQVPTQITPLVAELAKTHPAIFPNLNRTYTYEPVRFPRFAATDPGFYAAGEIEVAAFGPSALALSVTNAHLEPRIVADIAQDGGSQGFYLNLVGGEERQPDQKPRRHERPHRHRQRQGARRPTCSCAKACAATAWPIATSPRSKPTSPTCCRCWRRAKATSRR